MRIITEIDPAELGHALTHHKQEVITVLDAIAEAFGAITTKFKEMETVQIKTAKPESQKAVIVPPDPIVKPPEPEKKKIWNEKQKKDIQAIKDAVNKQKRSNKANNFRQDIDDSLIVYMRDEQNMKLKQIAKELGCSEQTVLNRYNKSKGAN